MDDQRRQAQLRAELEILSGRLKEIESELSQPGTVLARNIFDAMKPSEQYDFIRNGGKLVDVEVEK